MSAAVARGTPLQEATVALRDVLLDMRDDLDEETYSWFIAIGCDLFGNEATRLFVAEALRAVRDDIDLQRRAA